MLFWPFRWLYYKLSTFGQWQRPSTDAVAGPSINGERDDDDDDALALASSSMTADIDNNNKTENCQTKVTFIQQQQPQLKG